MFYIKVMELLPQEVMHLGKNTVSNQTKWTSDICKMGI